MNIVNLAARNALFKFSLAHHNRVTAVEHFKPPKFQDRTAPFAWLIQRGAAVIAMRKINCSWSRHLGFALPHNVRR
jgi:hypothetical protein